MQMRGRESQREIDDRLLCRFPSRSLRFSPDSTGARTVLVVCRISDRKQGHAPPRAVLSFLTYTPPCSKFPSSRCRCCYLGTLVHSDGVLPLRVIGILDKTYLSREYNKLEMRLLLLPWEIESSLVRYVEEMVDRYCSC
jgi:hypothetical protein